MTERLKVLFWGHADEGPCAYFRGYMFDEPWKELGIDVRHLTQLTINMPIECLAIPEHQKLLPDHICDDCRRLQLEGWVTGAAQIDTSPIDWADVVVFRRYYNTTYRCSRGPDGQPDATGCMYLTNDATEARKHELATGHKFKAADDITRLMWEAMRGIKDKAIIYETDDNHFEIKRWNGYFADVMQEQALIIQMTMRADLVTVSTPTIRDAYRPFNPRIRVIRNAIQGHLYAPTKKLYVPAGAKGKTRVLYYGSDVRIRDYIGVYQDGRWMGGGAYTAVHSMRDQLYMQFVGYGGHEIVAKYFDKTVPHVSDLVKFANNMANTHAQIGLAPLAGDTFDQNKSELHWLEYSAIGAATIGQRFMHSGPYQDVIRPRVDGLLARGHQEWIDALRLLVKNPGLREDMAAAAYERVMGPEYDYRKRAVEWADAFRWAHANRGIGLDNFRPSKQQLEATTQAVAMGLI